MDINKGLNTDIQPINLPSGSWIKAKNVIRQKGKGIQTHIGFNDLRLNLVGNIIGTIEIKSITIIFSLTTNLTKNIFEIGKLEGDDYTTICSTDESQYLNIDGSSQFTGTYTYNYKGEILISFFDWAKRGRPFLLNIDHLPFGENNAIPIQPKSNVSIERTLELMYLQPEFTTPFINLQSTSKGGNLKCGVYQFCIAYEIDDFDFTAPSLISEPIPIGEFGEKGSQTQYWKLNGSQVPFYTIPTIVDQSLSSQYGAIVSRSIKLKIYNLDQTYSRFKLIVLFRTGESNEAYSSGIYDITSDTIELNITGDEMYSESYESVVLGRARFKNIGAITKFQNKLSVLDVEYNDDEVWIGTDTYQVLANNIKLQVHIETVDEADYNTKINLTEDGTPTTFKSDEADLILKYSTFQPDEAYAFYIAFGKGDKISRSYHIPGRVAEDWVFESEEGSSITINESDDIRNLHISASINANNPKYLPIDSNEKLLSNSYVGWYQIRDTSDLANLKLGYWENQDEYYEGTTTKVRHHKMPSLKTIQDYVGGDHLNYRIGLNFDFSTLVIPTEVSDIYDTVYLLYADRTYNESTVLGMSPILSNRTGYSDKVFELDYETDTNIYTRFYDYGLNVIKPNISPTHIQSEFIIEHSGYDITRLSGTGKLLSLDIPVNLLKYSDTEPTKIREISSYFYIEEGDTSKSPKNTLEYEVDGTLVIENRESVLSLISLTDRSLFVESLDVYEDSAAYLVVHNNHVSDVNRIALVNYTNTINEPINLVLGTLKSFKSSVYVNYKNKNLILASCINNNGEDIPNGLLISNIATGIDLDKRRFLGDCVINNEYFRTKVNYFADQTTTYTEGSFIITSVGWVFPNYSRVNSNFRIDNKPINENETYSYNSIFSTRNSINLFQPSDTNINNVNRIRTRFSRSVVLGTESKELGWRNFNVEEYFDFPTSAGDGVYLHGGDLALLFGFSNDMYVAEIKETLDTGGGQTLALKTNNLFDVSPNRIQDVFDRSVQIKDINNIFITKYGFVFYDYVNKTIYLFDGRTQPLAISKLGIEDYIKSFTNVIKLTGGYDEATDHIFMTLLTSTNDWTTFSFYPTEKQFVSTYNFQLDNYFLNTGLLYGYTNSHLHGEIVKFNSGNPANYFATQFKSIIDLVFSDIPNLSKILESVIWNSKLVLTDGTTVEASNANHTIKDIIIYNDFGCSVSRPFTDNIKYINGNWHYNSITNSKLVTQLNSNPFTTDDELDYTVMDNTPRTGNSPAIVGVMYYVESTVTGVHYNNFNYMTGSKFTAITPTMITLSANSICYSIKKWFEKSNIICKFAVVRIVLNDATEQYKQVFLNDVIINYSKSI